MSAPTRIAWWVPDPADGFGGGTSCRPQMVIHTFTWPGVKAAIQVGGGAHFLVDRESVFETEVEAWQAARRRLVGCLKELRGRVVECQAALKEADGVLAGREWGEVAR